MKTNQETQEFIESKIKEVIRIIVQWSAANDETVLFLRSKLEGYQTVLSFLTSKEYTESFTDNEYAKYE